MGGTIIDPDYGIARLDSQEAIASLSFLQELLVGNLDTRCSLAIYEDELETFAPHHRAQATATGVACGALLQILKDDARVAIHELAGRPNAGDVDLAEALGQAEDGEEVLGVAGAVHDWRPHDHQRQVVDRGKGALGVALAAPVGVDGVRLGGLVQRRAGGR